MYYNSESLARDSIEKGLSLAYMKIPSNYTKAIIKTIQLTQLLSHYAYESFDGDHRMSNYSISIEIDMSRNQ